jgi:hypothetical protein
MCARACVRALEHKCASTKVRADVSGNMVMLHLDVYICMCLYSRVRILTWPLPP